MDGGRDTAPETVRVLEEFESQLKGETNVDEKKKHHEQGLSTQKTFPFQIHVKYPLSTISEMGNPFKDDYLRWLLVS